jgi:hypothetical protein
MRSRSCSSARTFLGNSFYALHNMQSIYAYFVLNTHGCVLAIRRVSLMVRVDWKVAVGEGVLHESHASRCWPGGVG